MMHRHSAALRYGRNLCCNGCHADLRRDCNSLKQVRLSLTRSNQVLSYQVSKGEESEYDIYLVNIEIGKPDEGFKSNVNQLDRYDAFCRLADLSIGLEVSPRLQMEAYENIEVYSR